jgi:putative flippase GtrA
MALDNREILRFIFAGLVNTTATYLLYLLLLQFFAYPISYTIAYVSGIAIAYWLSTTYVFRSRREKRSMILFPLVYVAQYLLGIAILYLSVSLFGVPQAFAALICIVCTIPITYVLSRAIVKTRKPSL